MYDGLEARVFRGISRNESEIGNYQCGTDRFRRVVIDVGWPAEARGPKLSHLLNSFGLPRISRE